MFLPGILGLHNVEVRTIRGLHLADNEMGWTPAEVRNLVSAHRSFPSFCEAYFARPLARYGKVHWAEKTPANVLQFGAFMKAFEESHIIHITRSPYDTVASLIARGMSAYEAASVYLLYTSHGLAAREMHGYIEVRYESLVQNSAVTLDTEVLQSLGLEYTESMLAEGNPGMTGISRMQGWRSDEVAAVSGRSQGRYFDEPEDMQALIAMSLLCVRIAKRYRDQYRLQHDTIEKICAALNYPYYRNSAGSQHLPALQRDRRQILRRHWFCRLASPASEYPVVLDLLRK